MCSGTRPPRYARSSADGQLAPLPRPPRTPRPVPPRARSSRVTTAAARTRACSSSTASISPGSMRKPRTLTCWSTRPRYSSSPSGQPPDPVAGPVQPSAPLSRKGIGDEPLRRQLRPPQVAPRQPRPAQVQLPHHSHRHRLQRRAEHVRLRVRHRPADRHPRAAAREYRGGGVDARLRGSVQVHHLRTQRRAAARRQPRRRAPRPPEKTRRTDATAPRSSSSSAASERGDELNGRDPFLRHGACQLRRVPVRLRPGHHQRRPGQQRRPELPDRGVEAERRRLQHAVVGREREGALHPPHVVGERAVGITTPLGRPVEPEV